MSCHGYSRESYGLRSSVKWNEPTFFKAMVEKLKDFETEPGFKFFFQICQNKNSMNRKTRFSNKFENPEKPNFLEDPTILHQNFVHYIEHSRFTRSEAASGPMELGSYPGRCNVSF